MDEYIEKGIEIENDLKTICEKYDIKNVVLGYQAKDGNIGVLGIGEHSKQYEITAMLFGYMKSQYHEFITKILTKSSKDK